MRLKVVVGVVCYYGDYFVASFNPPDVPSDEESQTVQDIDEDELEWQKWLADLMNPCCKC